MSHENLAPGTRLPLLCTYRNNVAGRGFLAKVEMRGRLLAVVEEDGSFWIHAVRPAGWAEGGTTLHEAFAVYRNAYTAILYDIADEAGNFTDFRDAVNALDRESEPLAESWREAVQSLRPEWAEQFNLRTEPAATMPYFRVEELRDSEASPASNQLDPVIPALAKDAA